MDRSTSVLAIHMGPSFVRLSPMLRRIHVGKSRLEGIARVDHGKLLSRIICGLLRLPRENPDSHLSVECTHTKDTMVWKRYFDDRPMRSFFKKDGDYLVECVGPMQLAFKVRESHGNLIYDFVSIKIFGLPVPKLLSPRVVAFEQAVGGKYNFSVEVSLYYVGTLIAYRGELNEIDV